MARKLFLYGLVYTPKNNPSLIGCRTVVLIEADNHDQARVQAREKCEKLAGRAEIQVHSLLCGRCRTEAADSLPQNLGRSMSEEEAAHLFVPKRAVKFNPAHDYGRLRRPTQSG